MLPSCPAAALWLFIALLRLSPKGCGAEGRAAVGHWGSRFFLGPLIVGMQWEA